MQYKKPVKKILFIAALLFFSLKIISAQTVTFSPSLIDDKGFDNVKIIGQDEDGFYLLQSNLPLELERDRVGFRNRKYKIAYYTDEMVPRWSKAVDALTDGASVHTITFFHNKIIVITGIENKAESTVAIYGYLMNNKGEIISNHEIGKVSLENNSDYDKAKIITSSNHQLSGIMVHEYIDEQKQSVHLMVIDTALKLGHNKKLSISYGSKKFTATGYSLSDKGDFHLIGVRSVKDKNAEKKRQEDFILFSAAAVSSQFSEFLVSEGNKDITGASINFDNINNKIICAGFYVDRSSTTGAGIIYATLDMNDISHLNIKTKPIDSSTQVKLLGERNSGYDIGLVSYPIQKIILRNDGGAVIIAEASYTTDYAYYDYFTQSYTRRIEYHFNNIVVISVNGNGSIHWLNVIRKNQESEDDGAVFSSFCPVLSPEEITLIYNSDISRYSEVITAHISNTGEEKENKPVRSNDHLLLLATSGKQVSENEVVIPCIAKKKLMLAKFTF